MDNMTLASKEEVRKTIIELISIANLHDERDDAIIARAMNVPAYYISADMNNSMTYQNIIDGRKEFVAYSLQPFICAIEDRLSMDDITPRGHVVKFAIEESFLRVINKEY